jgi:TetR/AcrR family hemagglutinin/protease transcriptional regulator
VTAKPKRTRLQPLERRAQLVGCAISAFAEYGLARGTHSQVAELAGVSVSAVHSYFRSRDDLVKAALDEVESHLLELVLSTLGGQGSVAECLEALAIRFTQSAHDHPDLFKVWLDWSTGVRADAWPRYVKLQARLIEAAIALLTRGKREGVIPQKLNIRAAARLFIGGGHTVVLMKFAGVSAQEIDFFADHMVASAMGTPPT